MRLIDADELEIALQDFKEWEDDSGYPIHYMSERQRISKCIEIAREQPTAYNLDKVVEQLDEIKCHNSRLGRANKLISKDSVIEIVKAGGKENG